MALCVNHVGEKFSDPFLWSAAEEAVLAMGICEADLNLVKEFEQLCCCDSQKEGKISVEELYVLSESISTVSEQRKEIERRINEVRKEEKRMKSEKEETERLKERCEKLARENQRLTQRKMCRKCQGVELSSDGVTFLPCGHFITCEACSESYENCPACGSVIMGTVKTFLA